MRLPPALLAGISPRVSTTEKRFSPIIHSFFPNVLHSRGVRMIP
jgi:hypothetical protein